MQADRRLAAAGLADEAEHLALARSTARRRRPPAPRLEVLDQALDLEHWLAHCASRPRGVEAGGAVLRAGPGSSGGTGAARSSARGQRGANVQASGCSASDGTRPGIS